MHRFHSQKKIRVIFGSPSDLFIYLFIYLFTCVHIHVCVCVCACLDFYVFLMDVITYAFRFTSIFLESSVITWYIMNYMVYCWCDFLFWCWWIRKYWWRFVWIWMRCCQENCLAKKEWSGITPATCDPIQSLQLIPSGKQTVCYWTWPSN